MGSWSRCCLPGAASGADSALAALEEAGTVTIDASAQDFDATVRRTTTGTGRVDADFHFRADTDPPRHVQARQIDLALYTKDYGVAGPWVRLDTPGTDFLSVTLAGVDPAALLAFAVEHPEHTTASRDGLFGTKYSVYCADAPLVGNSLSDAPGDLAADPVTGRLAQVEVHLDFAVNLRGRPTSITYQVSAGNVLDESMTLRLSDFAAPLAVSAPRGARPSPLPSGSSD